MKEKIKLSYSTKEINWQTLKELYEIAPLGEKTKEQLKIVFENSQFKCFIFQESQLIGAGRVLSDGFDCAYLCDVAIHPDYQGMGIGKKLMGKLINYAKDHSKIILYANAGKEGFYQKLGFQEMKTAMAIFKDPKKAKKLGII